MKIRLLVCLLVAAALSAAGCRKPSNEPPVATPSLTVSHTRVPLGSPLDISYEFVVAPAAPAFSEDYRVFVHFVDADDELMWADDHLPPVPTSQWKPGQRIKYSRLAFIPVYPYVGEATIRIGLYGKDGKRLTLAAPDTGQRAYKMATIQMAPQTESVYVTFKDGWHLAETAPDNPTNEWHWTKKDATLSFRNPKRNSVFYLEYGGQPAIMTEPQTVSVIVGGQVVDTFPIGQQRTVRRIPVGVAQFGPNDQVEITLSVDRTFVPTVVTGGAQPDKRELGLCVFHAYVDAR